MVPWEFYGALILLCFCFAVKKVRVCFGPRFRRALSLLCTSVSIHLLGPLAPSLSASASLSLANFVFPPVSPSLPPLFQVSLRL